MIPFNYHLAEDELQVRVGRFVVRRVPYDQIDNVRYGYTLWNEHWINPWPPRFVAIQRRTGWIRNFVINPPDRDAFMDELGRKIWKKA